VKDCPIRVSVSYILSISIKMNTVQKKSLTPSRKRTGNYPCFMESLHTAPISAEKADGNSWRGSTGSSTGTETLIYCCYSLMDVHAWVVCLVNQRLFLSLACFLLLVSLAAVPVLAATVTCPASCSCLFPAEAKKLGYPGYCQGKQAVCGYDTQKNEKYCYEKPAATTIVPQPIITVKPFITLTPTTVAPQDCAPGCTCLSTEDGKAKGLAYCNRQMTVCGKDRSGAASYCYSGMVATTAATPPPAVIKSRTLVPATTTPVASCPVGCSCLDSEKAGAAGMKQCSGSSAACSTDPLGGPLYCYVTDRVTKEGTAAVSTTIYPAYREMPPASVPAIPAPVAPAPGGSIVSQILNFFGLFFGAPQTGAPSQFVLCNGALTNLLTDSQNCGSCGNRCPNLNVCCRGTCFDFWYDANNCGGCGQVCPELTICCQGTCTYYQNDTRNCGWCDHRCGEREVCCSGNCRDQDDAGELTMTCNNLGGIVAAAIAIPLAVAEDDDDVPDRADPCTNATPCLHPGMTCCSDLCRNLNTSAGNCGSCGYVCPASPYCSGGTCTNLSPLA